MVGLLETIHLENIQVLRVQYEGCRPRNRNFELRNLQGIVYPYRHLSLVLAMLFQHGLVIVAFCYGVSC